MKFRVMLALPLALVACGGAANDVSRFEAAAERAYSAGRYDEAAAQWRAAADTTREPREREEARYRQATSLERAGRLTDARMVFETLLRESPRGPRAARAAYDRATTLIAQGDVEHGYVALDALLRSTPESGLAPSALRQYLDGLAPRGELAVRSYLDKLAPTLERSELGQFIHYAYAESLERSGELEAARGRFLLVADRYPYPAALWDDALWNAADLEARLGNPTGAIGDLERMLKERETSYFTGSYEHSRYAEAQFRIGELYRDELHDPVLARAAFERLWNRFQRSRLRDDAAWSAAILAHHAGDAAGACRNLAALVDALPMSRYVPCAVQLCPALRAPPGSGECHDYLVRQGAQTANRP